MQMEAPMLLFDGLAQFYRPKMNTKFIHLQAFGQAPDDLLGVFAQRLRWAMGALQVGVDIACICMTHAWHA